MLDFVGLLTAGNEEMLRFAWKTFARWQMRADDDALEKQKKRELYDFMKRFRETFCRPIEPIRFLGLFDCVNSVPQFESAWMSRTKFPYTANSSAKVIRHAVSIDERRAKFRQDLISEKKLPSRNPVDGAGNHWHHHRRQHQERVDGRGDRPKHPGLPRLPTGQDRYRTSARRASHRPSIVISGPGPSDTISVAGSQISIESATLIQDRQARISGRNLEEEEEQEQDILEVWFAGEFQY